MAESNEIPSVDEMIQRSDQQAAQKLQRGYKQAQGLIDRQIAQGRQAILNQYEIRRLDMRRKYSAETDPKRKQTILDQTMSAKSQATARIQALMDKHAPEKQELDIKMQTEVQKMQSQMKDRNLRIQHTRQLVGAGFMDPTQAKKSEYKLLGINWEPPRRQQSLQSRKAALSTDIRNLDTMLKKFTPGEKGGWLNFFPGGKPFENVQATITDPFTGEERELNPKNADDKAIIERMRELNGIRKNKLNEYQQLLIEGDPTLRANIDNANKFEHARKTINGGNQNTKVGGSIEASIRKQKGEKAGTGKPIYEYSASTGQTRVSFDGEKTWQIIK